MSTTFDPVCKWSFNGDDTHREFVIPGPFKKEGVTGKKICADCCRFLGWVWAEPAIQPLQPGQSIEEVFPRRDLIFLLQHKQDLMNDWEKKFVADLSRRNIWSVKQEAAFQKIRSKYYETANEKSERENTNGTQQPQPVPQPIPVSDDDFYVPF